MSWETHLRRYVPALILGLAAVLRIYALGVRDFWYDEAFTANMIRHDWMKIWSEIAYDVHPPLHYILLKAYSLFTGTGVLSLRFFSVLCGLGSVWLVYLIGKHLFTRRAGIYAALITSLSPFAIQYSQETRMYALYALLILGAVYCFIRAVSVQKGYGWWMAWGASFSLACLTHYMALVFLGTFFLAWIVMRLDERTLLPSKGLLLGGLVGFLIFMPWTPVFLHQLKNSQDISSFKTAPTASDIVTNLQIFLVGTPKGELAPWASNPNIVANIPTPTLTFFIVTGLSLIILFLLLRSTRKTLFLSSLCFGVLWLSYILSSFEKYYFISRYVLPAGYILYLLLGYWISLLPRLSRRAAIAAYVIGLLLIQPTMNARGFNEFLKHLPEYSDYHFYSLNTFDYMLAKYYVGSDRLTLFNTNWPPYDSRPWPGIGYETKRTESFEDLKNDPRGIVIWNVQFPLERRDDKNFDTSQFERIAKYQNVELYRPKAFLK